MYKEEVKIGKTADPLCSIFSKEQHAGRRSSGSSADMGVILLLKEPVLGCFDRAAVIDWIAPSPPNSHVDALTLSTSQCDYLDIGLLKKWLS